MNRSDERGQSVVETVFVVLLLTLLISAIIQIFLVHNYTFQMANNAYYSLFKDRAYGHNRPSERFHGFPNYYKKPLRSVKPWPRGGRVHELTNSSVNWSEDDRASVPMMPFFRDSIIDEMKGAGITAEPVRLKIGRYRQGWNHLDTRFMFIAAGTKGNDLRAIFWMLESLIGLTTKFGGDLLTFTGGHDDDSIGRVLGGMERENRRLSRIDNRAARDRWDVDHGDFDHDGRNDRTGRRNRRPW